MDGNGDIVVSKVDTVRSSQDARARAFSAECHEEGLGVSFAEKGGRIEFLTILFGL